MEDNRIPWWGKQKIENFTASKKSRTQPFLAVAGFAAIIAAMVGAVAFAPDPAAPRPSSFNAMAYPANVLGTIGQCGDTFNFAVPAEFTGKIPDGFFANPNGPGNIERTVPVHPMIVPAYGYFYETRDEPAKTFWNFEDKKILPQSFEYLSYLWNGWTIVWYDDKVEEEAKKSIKQYVSSHEKVMAMPWMNPGERALPLDRSYAFSSWGVTRSCGLWDGRLLDDFIEFSQDVNKDRDISNPYPAKLDDSGELRRIAVPK